MKKTLFKEKNLLLLVTVSLICALLLSAASLLADRKIENNQKAEIEETLLTLFPSGKDLNRKEEASSFYGVRHLFRYTDTKGETAALAVVLTVKDQHSNTFLLVTKKDGSLIGIRPLLTFGAHAFPKGDYNEEFFDSFRGQKAPFSFEEGMEDSEHIHLLRPLSREVNSLLKSLAKEGDVK